MSKAKYYLMFIASMVIFGTNGLLVAHISLGSAEIVLMRTLLGSISLLIVVLATKSFSFADLKADIVPATVGGAALGLNWVALFIAYRAAGVSLSTLTYYCGPIIVLALSPFLFKEKLSWQGIAAVCAVAVGMILMTGKIDGGTEVSRGIVTGFIAAMLYAILIICGKRVNRMSGLNCAFYELLIAFVVVLIYLVVTGVKLPVIPAKGDIVYVIIIGLVNTGLAYFLYFSSLQKLPAQSVALICYTDPLTALFFSAVFLNETMLPAQIVGAVLILGGAMLGELRKKDKKD